MLREPHSSSQLPRPSSSTFHDMANIDEKKLQSENKHVENVEAEALSPDFEQEIISYAPRLRGRSLTMMLAFVAGTGFTLFGCVS